MNRPDDKKPSILSDIIGLTALLTFGLIVWPFMRARCLFGLRAHEWQEYRGGDYITATEARCLRCGAEKQS